ncbi:solute:sodium symporter family transporter [Psychroflexus sp. CAK8W]|uniref:Solute:sodium symporter family transporter n=1 Tax=Psychroflexus longus TaxID=2873596 RepID=A0ABS7XJM4_9FLAO|nr:solute:sodium symporter family transporter [Psychroflexus longus]MBZ9778609.1 solute:sodium symporter family transporter [Psychroflexus longus]
MIDLLSFIGFTALVAVIAYLATRKTDESTADGFYLGGRSLTAITIAGSLLLTNLSTEQIVGLNGQAFTEGILVMAWETLAAIAMVITALFLLPKYLKKELTTITEFIENRFDQTTKTLITILFLSGYVVVLLPSILYSGSLALSTIFGIPEMLGITKNVALWLTIWSIGIIGMIYAIFGGLKAVAVSDLINAIGLFIGGLMIPFFGLYMIGDSDVLEGIKIIYSSYPEKFDAQGDINSSIPFGTIFTGMMLVQLFYWGTNQAIVQRVFAAKNLKEGQKGLLLAAFVKILGPLIVVLPGIIAFHFFQGNLASPDEAYPALVQKVLPASLVGFFAAVLFGAILSSFNSALNSAATLFGFDLYRQYIKKEATEKQTVKAGKLFGVFLAILGMSIAPFIQYAPDGLFSWLQEANGCYTIPILSIVVIGFSTKKVPAIAAKVGLISGVVLYSISQFVMKPILTENALEQAKLNGISSGAELSVIAAEAYPHFLHVMAILFVINMLLMLIIGKLYPNREAYIVRESGAVDIQKWKYASVVGIAIVVLVVSTYIIFN